MADLDEPVISEVHMETCPPRMSSWCTRFVFSPPAQQQLPAQVAMSPAQAAANTHSSLDEHSELGVDSDGDMIIPDRPERKGHFVMIHHSVSTPVSRCGEQVWLGACLLSDFILSQPQLLTGQTVVELGAGVGLVSIVAALYARHVFLTDADRGALQLAAQNCAKNSSLWVPDQPDIQQHDPSRQLTEDVWNSRHAQNCSPADKIRIRALDWLQLFDTQLSKLPVGEVLQLLNSPSHSNSITDGTSSRQLVEPSSQQHTAAADLAIVCQEHQQSKQSGVLQDSSLLCAMPDLQQHYPQQQNQCMWQLNDLALLASAGVWLAADVVYSETLTDAFMRTAHRLLAWQRRQRQMMPSSHDSASFAAFRGLNKASGHTASSVSARRHSTATEPRLFVAVEKRFNFTFRDLDARASAFDHFMTYVKVVQGSLGDEQQQQQSSGSTGWSVSSTAGCSKYNQPGADKPLFLGKRWDVSNIPQAVEYDRSGDLELWELLPLTHEGS